MTTLQTSNKRRIIEIVFAFMTAAGKFIFMDWLGWRLPFIAVVIVGWTIYVIARRKRVSSILQHWGFRTDNFRHAMTLVLPFGIVAIVICFLTGYFLESLNLTWHIIPALILYPLWGIIQQFLVIAIVAGNLQDLEGKTMPKGLIILVTALLFGALHFPFYWLILGTFVLALFYGYVFLKVRNIYVMGIFHGWLGAVFFYTVVGRDPFAEVFGKLF